MTMVAYSEVVKAARETVTTILAVGGAPREFSLSTHGGRTANVWWSKAGAININLPSYGHDTELTRNEADRIVGLVAHECAHVIYTNPNSLPSGISQALHSMTNWIEDIRIEKALLKTGKLPGLIDVFSTMETQDYWRAVKGRAAAGQPEVGATRGDFGAVLALVARVNNGYTIPGSKQALAALPAFARPVMAYAIKAVTKVSTTAAAVTLATDILNRLRDAVQAEGQRTAPPPPPPPPTPAPAEAPQAPQAPETPSDSGETPEAAQTPSQDADDGDGQPEDGAEDADGAAGAPESPQEDPAGDDRAPESPQEDPAGEQGEPNPDAAGGGDVAGTGAGGQPSGDDEGQDLKAWQADPDTVMGDDKGQDIAEAVKARDGEDATNKGWQSRFLTFEGAEVVTRLVPHPGYAAAVRPLLPTPGPLRDQITQLIRADERFGVERYRSTGRLDRRAMVRTSIDATNVYTRRTHQPGVDTAVGLLLDGSGSMLSPTIQDKDGNWVANRWVVASLLALHLSEAIEAARGKVAIWQFREAGDAGGVRLRTIKGFDDALDADRLGLLCDDGTPLSLSMIAAADELAGQPASRRILLALTDGSCELGTQATHLATEMCEARGVEVVGIGCGIGVGGAFPGRNVDVRDLSRLPEDGLSALLNIIRPADQGD